MSELFSAEASTNSSDTFNDLSFLDMIMSRPHSPVSVTDHFLQSININTEFLSQPTDTTMATSGETNNLFNNNINVETIDELQGESQLNSFIKIWAIEEKYENTMKELVEQLEDLMEAEMETCNRIVKLISFYKKKLRK